MEENQIDLSELRDGNKVKTKNNQEEIVRRVHKETINDRPKDYFQGIPLTKNLLEALRFKKHVQFWIREKEPKEIAPSIYERRKQNRNKKALHIYERTDGLFFKDEKLTHPIKFVHQLQNLILIELGETTQEYDSKAGLGSVMDKGNF